MSLYKGHFEPACESVPPMARHLFPLSAIVNRTLHPSLSHKKNSNLWICANVQFVHLTAKQTSRAEHGTRCLTSGCHGNALSGFIPLLISQQMWVWQGRVMSFFDFYLLQPHKHRLTLISVLNASPCKVSESGPSFFFFFPPPSRCPSSVFFLTISATCCPSFVTANTEAG